MTHDAVHRHPRRTFALLVIRVAAIGAFSVNKHLGELALGVAFVLSILLLTYRRPPPVPLYDPYVALSQLGVGVSLVFIGPVLGLLLGGSVAGFLTGLGVGGAVAFQFWFGAAFALVGFFAGFFLIAFAAKPGSRPAANHAAALEQGTSSDGS
jgi:hypothetical protein